MNAACPSVQGSHKVVQVDELETPHYPLYLVQPVERADYGLHPMAAPRYDPNAYLIVDVDTKASTHLLTNLNLVDWNTRFSTPYRG